MKFLGKWLPLLGFRSSSDYWLRRYRLGGDSGAGSGGVSASYKAQVLNRFVVDHQVQDVVEFGCGDGRQLQLAKYPAYVGFDISADAVARCRQMFAGDASKQFFVIGEREPAQADLALSLDVLFHLVEDATYDAYLDQLFAAARRFVAIYSTVGPEAGKTLRHVRHRAIAQDVAARFPDFERMLEDEERLPAPIESRPGGARFVLYARR
jgi:SAM-dependent methyltransferase